MIPYREHVYFLCIIIYCPLVFGGGAEGHYLYYVCTVSVVCRCYAIVCSSQGIKLVCYNMGSPILFLPFSVPSLLTHSFGEMISQKKTCSNLLVRAIYLYLSVTLIPLPLLVRYLTWSCHYVDWQI